MYDKWIHFANFEYLHNYELLNMQLFLVFSLHLLKLCLALSLPVWFIHSIYAWSSYSVCYMLGSPVWNISARWMHYVGPPCIIYRVYWCTMLGPPVWNISTRLTHYVGSPCLIYRLDWRIILGPPVWYID